jgi:hypothetical protein
VNSAELTCSTVIEHLKRDFGALWQCRPRGNSLEIITPFSTATQEFVSVFITVRDGQLIVSDGGWLINEHLSRAMPASEVSFVDCIGYADHFGTAFGVSKWNESSERVFFYKRCENLKLLSNAVYDVANFVSSVVNASTLPCETEDRARKQLFRSRANVFFKENYGERAELGYRLPDVKTARFSVAVLEPSNLSLIMYVSGSAQDYFTRDFHRAIVNFELLEKSKMAPHVKRRIAFLDDEAEGYGRNEELIQLLEVHHATTVTWREKGDLAEMLN